MKWVLGIVLVVLVISSGLFYFLFLQSGDVESIPQRMIEAIPHSKDTNEKASKLPFDARFFIYTDGTQRSFQAAMYQEQSEVVYIPFGETSTVRVAEQNITWDDFFHTLPFSIDENCLTTGTGRTYCTGPGSELLFVLNGEIIDGVLSRRIQKGDELLVSFGSDPARIEQELEVFKTR